MEKNLNKTAASKRYNSRQTTTNTTAQKRKTGIETDSGKNKKRMMDKGKAKAAESDNISNNNSNSNINHSTQEDDSANSPVSRCDDIEPVAEQDPSERDETMSEREEEGHEQDDDQDDQEREEDDEEEDEEGENDEEEEDDEDDDDAPSMPHSLSLQMQELFGGLMPSGGNRFRTILANLKSSDDPTMQLIALQELAEILSVSSEDTLAGSFSNESFVKELVRIMKGPEDLVTEGGDMDQDMMLALAMSEGFGGGNPEVMLLACRCICNLLDAMPTAVTSVVFHGAIRVLCQKLKSIQYIDLAEQALYALEKIAAQLPRAVVHESGLSAALMYFDFFSIHAQRTALRTAANCMRGIDLESFPQVLEVTPTLMNTISYPDRTVVELTCVCWVRISESYRSHRESLERTIQVGLLQTLFGLIPVPGNTNAVRPATFQDILRIFRASAKGSPLLALKLINLNLISSFYQILTGSTEVPEPGKVPMHINLDVKWKDTIPPMMKTIVDLIPSLPRGGMFSTRRFKEHSSSRRTGDDLALDPRVLLFKEKPEVMLSIDTILIPLVLDIYVSTVNLRVRQLITHGLVKIIHYSDIDTLTKVLESLSFSSFLSGILTRQEHPSLLIDALYQCELLSDKMPAIYHSLFEREGVLHEIELISKLPFEQPNSSDPAAAPTEESDAATNTDGDRREEESEEEERSSQRSPDPEANRGADRTSLARRLIERNELAAILRNRYDISRGSEQEKGIGKGSTRKYIIQLAQNFIEKYGASEAKTVAGSNLKDIQRFTHALKEPSDADPLSQQTLIELSSYLRAMGISSFELINSGLIKALLSYLMDKDGFKSSLDNRHRTFEQVFVHQTDIDKEGNNALKKLVHRLQELLARFETFEVVMPLESSDTARNPIGMLAKQLRLKLTGRGEGIPNTFQQLMVSTHAVATFRVLEEYLLARIGEPRYDEEEDEEDDEEEEEEHLLFEHAEEEEEMDEDGDTIMTEAVVIKDNHSEEEEDEEKHEEKHEENPSDASKEAESSSQAQKKKEGEWEIRFYVRDAFISNDTTIYAAVHQYESQSDQIQRNIWTSAYPITFERVWVTQEDKHKEDDQPVCQLANIEQPKELKEDSVCLEAIHLLKALSEFISVRPDGVEAQDFINRKLTAKMNRQLEEPLTVASSCLPRWSYWLMSNAPFLFPFETRYLFIQSTSFGYSRLISRWQSLQMRNNTQNGPRDDGHHQQQQPLLGRMERQKVRIIRSQILESAIKILDLFGSSPAVLEIEYADEEGTGLGPTLEFYASASKEFCKHSINMWYGSVKSETGYLDIAQGLFPKSLARQRTGKSAKKIINLFKTLGRFVAKALLDFRIIDIPFNAAFFKVVFDETKPSPELLKEIDPVLATSLNTLQAYVKQKQDIYQDDTKSNDEKIKAVKGLTVNDAKIEDLCLDFTLPGDSTYDLKKNGAEIPVTIQNVEEYLELLQDTIAGSGIRQQIDAFKEGFNELFAIDDLKLLTCPELVALFGKSKEDWSYSTLADAIKADHGFTMESQAIKYLLQVLSEFSPEERRQFLQFTTGSPRLPIGGWKVLRPVFTVVRKVPEAPMVSDDYLPSVMTCANYLKMPEYSSKEAMHEKLVKSMTEGQNSFLLS